VHPVITSATVATTAALPTRLNLMRFFLSSLSLSLSRFFSKATKRPNESVVIFHGEKWMSPHPIAPHSGGPCDESAFKIERRGAFRKTHHELSHQQRFI
jgi:hypothetical protein